MLKKISIYSIGFIALGLWFWAGSISNGFLSNPISPDPSQGRVIPFELKGNVFYISTQEQQTYRLVLIGGIVLFFIYIAAYILFLKKKKLDLTKQDLESK